MYQRNQNSNWNRNRKNNHTRNCASHRKKTIRERRIRFYNATVREVIWKEQLQRIQSLYDTLCIVNIDEVSSVREVFDVLISFVNEATKFYDQGLILSCPVEKKDAVNNFNDIITEAVRRNKTPFAYWNTSQPGEPVTSDNLYFGEAVEYNANNTKNKKIPSMLLKEYNGKMYQVICPMTPISRWQKNSIRSLVGKKQLAVDYGKIINVLHVIQDAIISACKEVLDGESF